MSVSEHPSHDEQAPGYHAHELKEKAGWFRRRLVWNVQLSADDFEEFQPRFERFMTEVLEWRRRRGSKTAGVRFHARIHPWITGRVKQYLRRLRASESHAFLRDIPFYLELTALDGEPIEAGEFDEGDNAAD